MTDNMHATMRRIGETSSAKETARIKRLREYADVTIAGVRCMSARDLVSLLVYAARLGDHDPRALAISNDIVAALEAETLRRLQKG